MTEAEWVKCTYPDSILEYVGGNASERKLRLFGCACVQRALAVIPGDHYQGALDLAARYADGAVDSGELVARAANFPYRDGDIARYCFWALFSTQQFDRIAGVRTSVYSADAIAVASMQDSDRHYRQTPIWRAELGTQAELFRDIFGNPFRSVSLDPAWLTSDVLALARGIYDERAFDRMPILADALQDAGCDNDDILNHCRGDGPHVRGCWVVDLLLGKA